MLSQRERLGTERGHPNLIVRRRGSRTEPAERRGAAGHTTKVSAFV